MRGTPQLQWAWNNCPAEKLHSTTCFGILHPKSPLSSKNNVYFTLPIRRSMFFLVDKQWKESQTLSSLLLVSTLKHLHFFGHCIELICQTFLKPGQQNCNNVFQPKKMNSILFLFIFEQRNVTISHQVSILKTNRLHHYEWWHATVMTTAASRKMHLETIMGSRCQGDITFVTFRPIRIFQFWRNREITFIQKCLQPLYFSQSSPPTQSSLLFCAGIQFSYSSLPAFNNQIKIWQNRGLWTV